ncbi:MAG: stage III sporulation protein AE [Defluviitaleaceae bacterium]|nr:stage III sporulation protein AE [Defluviitaleaceae bacterium]
MIQAPVPDVTDFIPFDSYDIGILDMPGLPGFRELVGRAVQGELDLSLGGILNGGLGILFREFSHSSDLLRQLLIVAILSALMSCLSQAFSRKGAGEMGFYVTFLMTITLATASFYLSVQILNGVIRLASNIMLAAIPLMLATMAISGNFVGAASFHPLMFFALQLVVRFITYVYVPLILASAGLSMVNHLSDTVKLDKLAEMLQKIAGWALKGIVAVFAVILTLQRFSAPIISNLALRATYGAVGAIPVVGSALNAAMYTITHFGTAARSGLLVALVIVLIVAMITPLIKLLVLSAMYRLTAGFVQPVADSRLVSCLDTAGKHMGHLLSAGALVGVMCVYSVVILLSF